VINTIETLKSSPLFNLSLSSKELFHSNFLYWVGVNYPNEFGEFFAKYLNEKPSKTCIIEIFREKNNIDISFKYSNNQELLIENKVKSIPSIKQLEDYSKKHTDGRNYILLSLSEPTFFQSNKTIKIGNASWHYLSYSNLKDLFKEIIGKTENNYHKLIIEDYQLFIDALIKINQYSEFKEKEVFDFHSLESNQIYKSLKDIRLHDFYLKKKYELFAYNVYERLKDLEKNIIDFGQKLNWKNDSPVIVMGSGMTNGSGLMDMKYLISKDFTLGVQIQGDSYRMVAEDNNGEIAKKVKENLENNGLWFDFNRSFPNEKNIYPKPPKKFNRFKDGFKREVFFYKSVKLGTNRTIDEITDIILEDVEHIETNISDIQKIIKLA